MINQKYTRIYTTVHRPVETGVDIPDEGIALVYVKEGDQTVVRPSTGAPDEILAGFSLARNTPPLFMPYVEEGTIESVELELPRLPIAGQILVRVGNEVRTINASDQAPAEATSVSLDGNILRFHGDDLGKKKFVQMMYEPTITEARQWKGDTPVGGLPSTAKGIIGVLIKGDFSTTYFDASADWSGAIKVKLGPDGILTPAGNGAEAKDCYVLQAPSAATPILQVHID